MEKAGEVYNKLKLRFVGKAEVAAKPKTDDKEPEDDVKETQNTGKKPHCGSRCHLGLTLRSYLLPAKFIFIMS